MPEPGETVYWLSGAVEYALPLSLAVLVFCQLVRAKGWKSVVATARLAMLVGGLQEIAGITLALVLAVGTGSAFVLRSRARYRWGTALAFALVGTAINAFAPGNGVRLETEFGASNAHDVISTIRMTVLQINEYLLPWLMDPKLLTASVVLVASRWFRDAMPGWTRTSMGYWRVVVPGAWLSTIGASFLAVGLAIGQLGPKRLYNYLYAVFLLGWLASLFVWSRNSGVSDGAVLLRRARPVAIVLLMLALLTSVSVTRGIRDFAGEQNVMRFRREMQVRFQSIAAAKAEAKGGDVVIGVAPRIPGSFFQRDIGTDPQHWRNQCVANYFGVEQIRLASPGS